MHDRGVRAFPAEQFAYESHLNRYSGIRYGYVYICDLVSRNDEAEYAILSHQIFDQCLIAAKAALHIARCRSFYAKQRSVTRIRARRSLDNSSVLPLCSSDAIRYELEPSVIETPFFFRGSLIFLYK
jgi:hypothetical protein